MPTTFREKDPDADPNEDRGQNYRDGFSGAVQNGSMNQAQDANTEHSYTPTEGQARGVASTNDSNGSGFVNWDQYFNSNAQGAKNDANALAGSAGSAAGKAQNDIVSGEKAFNEAATAGTNTGEMSPTIGGSLNHPYDPFASGNQQLGPQLTSVEQATQKAHSGYSAPGSLLEAQFGGTNSGQKLSDEVEHANQGIGALQTNEGRQALFQNRGDTLGESQLDAALTGQAGGQSFRALAQKYGGLQNALEAANTRTAGVAASGRKISSDTAKRYLDAVGYYDEHKNDPVPGVVDDGGDGYRNPDGTLEQHTFAQEDPNGISAQIAQTGPGLIGAIGGPLAGAGVAAGMGVGQAEGNAGGKDARENENKYRQERIERKKKRDGG